MKTITLEEALKGATKGPFKTCTCGKCGLMWSGDGSFNVATVHKEWGDDPEHPDGTMTEEMRQHNLTLLAHCFNELPGLVEAVEKFIATYERLSGESFEDSAKENEALEAVALCAALRSATAVKMP